MLNSTQGHVCFRFSGRCHLCHWRSDESAPSLRNHRQRGEVVSEKRQQLAQLRPSAASSSLPLCRHFKGVSVCAGRLDTTGTFIKTILVHLQDL